MDEAADRGRREVSHLCSQDERWLPAMQSRRSMLRMTQFQLMPAPISDQRHPCGMRTNSEQCPHRAHFRLTPTCSETQERWPTAQVCARHLAGAVRIAAARCTGHRGGDTVAVRPMG